MKYAIKKEDPDAIQQEPIFYAHVEKVGLDTKNVFSAVFQYIRVLQP